MILQNLLDKGPRTETLSLEPTIAADVVESLHRGLLFLVIVCLFWYTKNMKFSEKKLLANFGPGQQISAMFQLCLSKQPLRGPVPTFISINMAVWEEAVAAPATLGLIRNQICVGKLGAACCARRLPCIFYERDNEMCRNVNMIRATAKQVFFLILACVVFVVNLYLSIHLRCRTTFGVATRRRNLQPAVFLSAAVFFFFTKTRRFGIIYHLRANVMISPYYFYFPPRFRVQSLGSV